MKKISIYLLLLAPLMGYNQNDLSITLKKVHTALSAVATAPATASAGEYELDFSSGGTITITSAQALQNVKIEVKNASGNSQLIFSTTRNFRAGESFAIPIDTSLKATNEGTTGNAIVQKFKVTLNDNKVVKATVKQGVHQQNNPIENQPDYSPTGIPLADAIALNSLYANWTTESKHKILHILSFYTAQGDTKTELKTWAQAVTFYHSTSSNTYLEAIARAAQAKDPVAEVHGGSGPGTANIFASALSSAGGLDVTNIADGFAKFIVKRTKQELSIAFFERFKEELEKPQYVDLRTVFPQTYAALKLMDTELYNYNAYIQLLRESFEKDLAGLPVNIQTIITNHDDFFTRMPEVKALLESAFYVGQHLLEKQHPGMIIENYPLSILTNIPGDTKPCIETMKLISTSVKSADDGTNYWASIKDIKKLADNKIILMAYLGLLEQQAKFEGITYSDGSTLATILDASYTSYTKYGTFYATLSAKIQSLQSGIDTINDSQDKDLLFENYYSVVTSSIDLMKFLGESGDILKFNTTIKFKEATAKYFALAQTSADLVIDIKRRNYSSAIVNATMLYDVAFNKDNNAAYTVKVNGAGTLNATQIAELKKRTNDENTTGVKKALFKYGAFMADIAQAKSSDDVEKVIEAVALPVGSARIKRETPFNVALNAYCGLFLGNEVIKNYGSQNALGSFNSFGVAAPIGISLSQGHKIGPWPFNKLSKDREKGWSSSWFISIVDLGAVTAYRFTDDDTEKVPTIQLKDIFSPGIFYSIGIPKTPLSLNFGAQVGPNLRKVGPDSNVYASETYVRYSVSFCVDLPILNLYTKN